MLYRSPLCHCVYFLALIFLHSLSPVLAQEMSAEDIIQQAIENRLKINSYDIEIEFDYGSDTTPRIHAARYYLDGKHMRVDLQFPYHKKNRFFELSDTHFWDRTIYLPDQSIHFSSRKLPGPGQLVVRIDKDPSRAVEDYIEAKTRHDLRSLGFHTTGVTLGTDIEKFLRTLSLPERRVRKEKVNGIDCLRVSFQLQTGIDCDFWFAPEKGYSPVRARGHYQPHNFTDEINLNVNEWQNSGLWYPVSYTSSRSYGNFAKEIENGSIIVHSLNEPLNQSRFEISALDVPVGRSVRTLPSNGPKSIWDGKQAVPKQAYCQSVKRD